MERPWGMPALLLRLSVRRYGGGAGRTPTGATLPPGGVRGLRVVRYEALLRYPAVERDFSFIFDDSIEFAAIAKTVAGLGLSELRSFVPVEIFRGGSIPAGKYSLLLRATFQSGERTLREDEVARWSGEIIRTLQGLGGVLRTS